MAALSNCCGQTRFKIVKLQMYKTKAVFDLNYIPGSQRAA